MITLNKRLIGIFIAIGLLLLIPLVAMQLTDEVNWKFGDFIIAGILLLTAGLMCEIAIRKISEFRYRIGICIVIIVALLLVWAELAVGIFGTPFGGS